MIINPDKFIEAFKALLIEEGLEPEITYKPQHGNFYLEIRDGHFALPIQVLIYDYDTNTRFNFYSGTNPDIEYLGLIVSACYEAQE